MSIPGPRFSSLIQISAERGAPPPPTAKRPGKLKFSFLENGTFSHEQGRVDYRDGFSDPYHHKQGRIDFNTVNTNCLYRKGFSDPLPRDGLNILVEHGYNP